MLVLPIASELRPIPWQPISNSETPKRHSSTGEWHRPRPPERRASMFLRPRYSARSRADWTGYARAAPSRRIELSNSHGPARAGCRRRSMMEEPVSFSSGGLKLAGILTVPDDMHPAEARPAVMVLHGFGGNKNGGMPVVAAELFAKLGYVTLRFDMRGCGNSEGVRGRVICLEQVEDTKSAVSFLAGRKE